MTRVAVAIITNKQRQVLIARRPAGKVMEGCWEFPGGKVEIGETPEECLVRELKEEMDLTVKAGRFIAEISYAYDWGHVQLLAFEAHIVEGEPRLLEHDAMAWVGLEEMGAYGMTPADEPLIEDLLRWVRRHDVF
ncbi:8-oxo-dGTP diphosphatase MutT [Anoxynatronum buryatiense]|uniref:8-oxo-dGTP diphosphatase n=1 Tax=Anoxynatronum buryatiense TaxID=489973 RepID=A0AA45WTX0_9CLOT|nr:8-oxo-dGTP diphosphatase MutT [Anoxynatronum buryatiense]SMP44153.1 8-oxo-dGTP diphosphatase [Anoxynatronum buryatiense]